MRKLFEQIEPETNGGLKINLPEMDLSSLTNTDGGISITLNSPPPEIKQPSTKKKKPTQKKQTLGNVSTETVSDSQKQKYDDMLTTNIPYETKYKDTNGMLNIAIDQLDSILKEVQTDTNAIRASKTLKRKYDLLTLLQDNAGKLINNKISAIRELNNTITKCNDFELRRMKELNVVKAAEGNSDKKMMDLYNAFVSMPAGGNNNMMMPNGQPSLGYIHDSLMSGNVITSDLNGNDDAAYQNFLENMNPSQKLSMYESNPNVQQVVVYNQQDGSRYFEVMDLSTGEVIKGVDKHDSMFLEDTFLDIPNKVARNTNLGETYPLVIVGEPVMNAY